VVHVDHKIVRSGRFFRLMNNPGYIIDEHGIITHIFSQVNTSTHAKEVLACVQ